jgi:hypothetical protein
VWRRLPHCREEEQEKHKASLDGEEREKHIGGIGSAQTTKDFFPTKGGRAAIGEWVGGWGGRGHGRGALQTAKKKYLLGLKGREPRGAAGGGKKKEALPSPRSQHRWL